MVHIPIKKINMSVESCTNIDIKTGGNYILIEILDGNIVVHNKSQSCIFCYGVVELVRYKNSYLCMECLHKLKNAKAGDYYY